VRSRWGWMRVRWTVVCTGVAGTALGASPVVTLDGRRCSVESNAQADGATRTAPWRYPENRTGRRSRVVRTAIVSAI